MRSHDRIARFLSSVRRQVAAHRNPEDIARSDTSWHHCWLLNPRLSRWITWGAFCATPCRRRSTVLDRVVGGRTRDFDTIVIGGGTFGCVVAEHLFIADTTRSRRILVLEAGPFVLPEHVQNMPFMGGAPDMRVPWVNHPALNYLGLIFAIGGRSLTWGGWSPELLDVELTSWPASTRADLRCALLCRSQQADRGEGDQ